MLNRQVLIASIVAALGGASAASAAKLPSWCSTDGFDPAKKGDDHNVEGALKKDDPAWALYYLAGASCSKDEDVEEHLDELAEARKYWNEKLDMTDADWPDVVNWAMAEQGARYPTGGFYMTVEEKRPWSAYDAIEQLMALRALHVDTTYLMDAFGPRLTQTARMAYISECLRASDAKEVTWAMCQPDIDAFEPGKVSAELRAAHPAGDQPLGFQRTIIRMMNYMVREKLAEHAAEVKKLIASDEGYAKLFDIAKAASKEWEGRTKSDAELLALVSLMDDARVSNSRKALDGCQEKTWAAWTAAVAKLPAKNWEGMHDDPSSGQLFMDKAMAPISGDTGGYLASLALGMCYATAERDAVVYAAGAALERWPGFRGPRNAALTNMLTAGIKLDDRGSELRFPHVTREWFGPTKYSSGGGFGKGVIASAKANGAKTHVVFVSQMVKQVQCAEYRETNRLSRIDSSGNLVYQQKCVKNETVTVNKASDPQDVDSRYTAGVKPGAYVSIVSGVTQAVWANATTDIPTAVFGVPVK